MTNKEAIEELKYSIEPNQGFMECRTGTISEEAIRMAIEALEKQMQNCENCRHAKHSSYNNIIYCLNLSRVMLSNNCCRNWIGKR